MIEVTTYQDRLVAIYGLGRTGMSAANSLKAGGAEVVLGDGKEAALASAAAQGFNTSELNEMTLSAAAALVLSPGVPLTHPTPHEVVLAARAQGLPIIGDTELFAQMLKGTAAKLITITGTNGKSTTTALIGHVLHALGLNAPVGGNIGTPVLELEPPKADSYYVVELSSYQLDLTQTLEADVAILLNFSADHLDRHGGMAGYQASKRRSFEMQPDGALAILGVDDPHSAAMCAELAAEGRLRVVPISAHGKVAHGVYVEDGTLFDAMGDEAQPIMQLADAPNLPGLHNGQNMAAAYAAARAMGGERAAIAKAIKTFPGLAHRIEVVGERRGVLYVNDSKATNAEAAEKALSAFKNIRWIAGGVAKEGGLAPLYDALSNVRGAYLIGECAAQFAEELSDKIQITQCVDMASALNAASNDAEDGDVVVLSPAAASFDQYKNFEARGDHFKQLVGELAA